MPDLQHVRSTPPRARDRSATPCRTRTGPVPPALRDASTKGARMEGAGRGYTYPHDHPDGVVAQQYAPDAVLRRSYYQPTRHGAEDRAASAAERLRDIVRAVQPNDGA